MAAFSLELHVHTKHRAMDPSKIQFFETKIVVEGSFDNPSNDVLDYHGKPPFV